MSVALSGDDSIIINNRLLTDLMDDDVGDLTFPNDVVGVKTGKNGNSIYALNQSGKQADLKLRIVRGSGDDKFLNNLFAQQQANFAAFPLMIGQFIKQIGDGAGNIINDTYITSGGVFQKEPEAKSNVTGDTAQAVVVWMVKFTNAPRVIT